MIISFIQTKGGTGKTTIAKCLAYSRTFRKAFNSIGLIELDPQGSLKGWHEERAPELRNADKVKFTQLLEIDEKSIRKELSKLGKTHDLIILDVAGESVGKFATKLAASLGNILLVPMRASTNDERSFADHILPILNYVIKSEPEKRAFILPTFFHPQTKAEGIKEYFTEIMPEIIGCLNSYIPTRGVYENFSRNGMTLFDYAEAVKTNAKHYQQTQKAIADIEDLAKEILELIR